MHLSNVARNQAGGFVVEEVSLNWCRAGAVGFGAFSHAGYWANIVDIGPKHAGTLCGISNTIATLPGVLANVRTRQTFETILSMCDIAGERGLHLRYYWRLEHRILFGSGHVLLRFGCIRAVLRRESVVLSARRTRMTIRLSACTCNQSLIQSS